MEDSLDNHFPWNCIDSLSNKLHRYLLCTTDFQSGNAEFSFVCCLIKLLKKDIRIILFCFNHSRMHYEYILRKNGIDMRNLERNNRIIIKEVIVDYETTNTISNNDEPTNWNQLCQWLHNGMIQQFEDTLSVNNDDFTFMIDDMEAMEITSLDSTTNSVQFMSRCLNQMYKQCGHCQGIICFGRKSSHSNTSSFSLSDYCRQRADIIVDVNPLSTGYSTDIHGIIRVYSRNLSPSTVNVSENNFAKADTTRIWQQSLIFKALDSGVKCSVIKKKIAVLKTI